MAKIEKYEHTIIDETISDYRQDYDFWKTKEKLKIWREVTWSSDNSAINTIWF